MLSTLIIVRVNKDDRFTVRWNEFMHFKDDNADERHENYRQKSYME